MKRKSEVKYFRLFTDRCNKLNMQFFVDLTREYPSVNWWYKGLSKEECWANGCVQTVANLDELWMRTYNFMKRIGKDKQLKNKTYEQ